MRVTFFEHFSLRLRNSVCVSRPNVYAPSEKIEKALSFRLHPDLSFYARSLEESFSHMVVLGP